MSRAAMYLYDPRSIDGGPTTGWGRRTTGRCVAYAHRRPDGWTVRDLRNGRESAHPTRTAAAERLVELAAADPALTLGGVR
jgi:hypothetical protein